MEQYVYYCQGERGMGFDPKADARRKAATRQKIIETGFRVFCEKTIDATSIQEIADAAGIGIATVYRHFSTKTALVADINTWIWNQYIEEGFHNIDWDGSTAAEILDRYLGAFIDLYRNHRDLLRYNQFFNVYAQREGIPTRRLKSFLTVVDTVEARFHRMYEKAKADGTLRTDVSEREMFSKTLHLMLAAVTRYAVGLVYDSGIAPEEELLFLRDLLLREYCTGASQGHGRA